MAKEKPEKGKRWFIANVHEEFSDTFRIQAKDAEEAKRIVDESIPDDFSPAQTGEGYRRHIYIDPD